jgi:hypothetical protein
MKQKHISNIVRITACIIVLGCIAASPGFAQPVRPVLTIPIGKSPAQPDSNGTGLVSVISREPRDTRTISLQLPEFDPADLETHVYKVGFFSATGSGNGSAYPDLDGLIEAQLPPPTQTLENGRLVEKPWHMFFYSVNVDTGEVQLFMDLHDITVNQAVHALSSTLSNAEMQFTRSAEAFRARMRANPPRVPDPIGDALRLSVTGAYLTVEDVLEQIFQATRCDVVPQNGSLAIASCD